MRLDIVVFALECSEANHRAKARVASRRALSVLLLNERDEG